MSLFYYYYDGGHAWFICDTLFKLNFQMKTLCSRSTFISRDSSRCSPSAEAGREEALAWSNRCVSFRCVFTLSSHPRCYPSVSSDAVSSEHLWQTFYTIFHFYFLLTCILLLCHRWSLSIKSHNPPDSSWTSITYLKRNKSRIKVNSHYIFIFIMLWMTPHTLSPHKIHLNQSFMSVTCYVAV